MMSKTSRELSQTLKDERSTSCSKITNKIFKVFLIYLKGKSLGAQECFGIAQVGF
jgi:hypothetical protein